MAISTWTAARPGTLAFSRGFEYLPTERSVTIRGGERRPRVSLERLDNLPAKGWWDGDNHFHMNYAGVYFNTPQRLLEQVTRKTSTYSTT